MYFEGAFRTRFLKIATDDEVFDPKSEIYV